MNQFMFCKQSHVFGDVCKSMISCFSYVFPCHYDAALFLKYRLEW